MPKKKNDSTREAEVAQAPTGDGDDMDRFTKPVFAYKLPAGRKMHPDESTYRILGNIASFGSTKREAAAIFGVDPETVRQFFRKHPKAAAAWERGRTQGKYNVRRMLHVTAQQDPATLRFLAKNVLGMTDGGVANTKIDVTVNQIPAEERIKMIEALQRKVVDVQAEEVEAPSRALDDLIARTSGKVKF